MKPILIGQAPSRTSDPNNPLSAAPLANRLAALLGVSVDEYLNVFDRANVLDYWPGRGTKGDLFPLAEARVAAELMKAKLKDRDVIFLGKKVAEAFRFGFDYLEWVCFCGGRAAVLPHPSGIVRWWNSPQNVRLAESFLKSAVVWNRSDAPTVVVTSPLAVEIFIGADDTAWINVDGFCRLRIGDIKKLVIEDFRKPNPRILKDCWEDLNRCAE